MLERFKLASLKHTRNKMLFWQYGNYAEEIYSNAFMWSKLNYIHVNLRKELSKSILLHIYSNAANYVK
jgi:hypothetical protein